MRLLFTLLLSTLGFAAATAQDVDYKNDMILVDDEPYARLKKKGAMAPTFTVATLGGEEFLTVVFDVDAKDYVATFVESGKSTRLRGTVGFGKWLAKQVVAARLVEDGKFSTAGERRFLAANPAPGTGAAPGTAAPGGGNTTTGPALVKRDRTRPITVMGEEITQDFTVIGTYTTRSSAADGTVYTIYTFALPDGTVVAEATTEGATPRTARMVTMKNNTEHNVSLEGYDRFTLVKGMAQFLVRNYYL